MDEQYDRLRIPIPVTGTLTLCPNPVSIFACLSSLKEKNLLHSSPCGYLALLSFNRACLMDVHASAALPWLRGCLIRSGKTCLYLSEK